MDDKINNTGDDGWQQQPEDALPTADATSDPMHQRTSGPRRVRPRTGPIVWGALFFTFCVWVAQRSFFPATIAPEMWLTFTAIGLGILLLAVGIIVGLGDRRRHLCA